MVKPYVLIRTLSRGGQKREESYIGKPGERCLECPAYKACSGTPVQGECKVVGGRVWGGALCPEFPARGRM